MDWLKDCEICNTGLCKAVDEKKESGLSERAACREMSEESDLLYSEDAILGRYRYYTGKIKACEIHTDQTPEERENGILRAARKIRDRRHKEKEKANQEERQEHYAYRDSFPAREGSPADRGKQVFQKKENDIYLICITLGPDEDHPYLETADFEISREDYESIKSTDPTKAFDVIFQLHNEKKIVCTKAGTWGDYAHPKSDIGCKNHFLNYSKGNWPNWFQSGLEHGFSIEDLNFDLRLLEPYKPTPEEKAQTEINYYTKNIARHYEEIEKLSKRLARLERR